MVCVDGERKIWYQAHVVGLNNSQYLLSWPGELYDYWFLEACASQSLVLQVEFRSGSTWTSVTWRHLNACTDAYAKR